MTLCGRVSLNLAPWAKVPLTPYLHAVAWKPIRPPPVSVPLRHKFPSVAKARSSSEHGVYEQSTSKAKTSLQTHGECNARPTPQLHRKVTITAKKHCQPAVTNNMLIPSSCLSHTWTKSNTKTHGRVKKTHVKPYYAYHRLHFTLPVACKIDPNGAILTIRPSSMFTLLRTNIPSRNTTCLTSRERRFVFIGGEKKTYLPALQAPWSPHTYI